MNKLISLTVFLIASFARADVVIYDEPQTTGCYAVTGWKAAPINGNINTCSFNNPYSGFACVEGTLTSNTTYAGGESGAKLSVEFEKFGWIIPTEFTSLVYHLRQKNYAGGRMNIHVFGGVASNTEVGHWVRVGYNNLGVGYLYGYSVANITSYQKITVPMSDWNFPAGTIINRFTWDVVNTNSGWYIDQITLVGNGVIHYPNPYPPVGP